MVSFFKKNNERSFLVSRNITDQYLKMEDFPFLVSFPRTGSHWLRMLMELYFDKPSLVRVFYFPNATNFTCYHTHDLDLNIKRRRVIYLYRSPAPTIFSQMKYHNQDLGDLILVKYWSSIYGLHLAKWLLREDYTSQKVIINYTEMKNDIGSVFSKLCDFFDVKLDNSRINDVYTKVSRHEVKKKTNHDAQVINDSRTYEKERNEFINNYGALINKIIVSQDTELENYL